MKLFNNPSLLLALALVTRASSRLHVVSNHVSLPPVRDDVAHKKDLAPRNAIYDQAVERGKAFLAQFNSNHYSAPVTGGTVADLGFQGWKLKRIPPPRGSIPDEPLTMVLQRLVGSLRNQYYEWIAKYDYYGEHASYRNLYGPEDGVIAALDNYNGAGSTPNSHWSEVTWRIWVESCESSSIDPKTLKYIVRHEVQNPQTQSIIMQVYEKAFDDELEGNHIVLIPRGTTLEGFQALLGSPNGQGIAWMLLNKRNVLGKKIAKITVEMVQRDTWEMCFELEEKVVAPPSAMTD